MAEMLDELSVPQAIKTAVDRIDEDVLYRERRNAERNVDPTHTYTDVRTR